MYNGCITGNTSTSGGGGVYVADSTTFTMYGGSIVDNKANPGRYASNGGGVYVAGGDTENKYFTMYGGSITGNHTAGDGGGIYSTSNNISIYGGGVTNNSVTKTGNAGGIYVSSSGTLTVGGNVNISGNWQGDSKESGSKNNVYLDYYEDDFATIVIEKELTGENSSIGVTTATPVATTKDASVKIAAGKGTHAITDADKDYFTPDTGYCEVQKKDDGALYLTHVHSGGEATCTAAAKCGGCGQQYGNTNLNNHALVHHEAKAPTCTAVGWEAYDTCSRCTYTTYREIPAAHTYGETWVKGQDGHWKVCEVCQNRSEVKPHNWEDATYTAPKTCTVCGATQGEPLTRSYYYYAPSAAENKKDSPKTADPGVLLYAGLALASLTGLACTAKKRH